MSLMSSASTQVALPSIDLKKNVEKTESCVKLHSLMHTVWPRLGGGSEFKGTPAEVDVIMATF